MGPGAFLVRGPMSYVRVRESGNFNIYAKQSGGSMGPMLGIVASPIGCAGVNHTVVIPGAPTVLSCKRRGEELLGCVANLRCTSCGGWSKYHTLVGRRTTYVFTLEDCELTVSSKNSGVVYF